MTHTTDPPLCPHCKAPLTDYNSIESYTRIGGGMILIACGSCRKLLGIVPAEKP